ncbi:cytidine/deoxycytidylate deaminase family protein [Streptomyces lydicus]|uniref:hypothetical protein n=1 Tax=Streptomyces lydicus TaxID=47763 RepID=UPI0036F96DD6
MRRSPLHENERRHLLAAIEIAGCARANGNHPFGALLADADGSVVLEAANTVVTDSDATGHAETNLVKVFAAGSPVVEVSGPHLFEQAAAVHAGFWD